MQKESLFRKTLDKLESRLLKALFEKDFQAVFKLLKKEESLLKFEKCARWLLSSIDPVHDKSVGKLIEKGFERNVDLLYIKPLRVEDYSIRPVSVDGDYYAVRGKVIAKSQSKGVISLTLATENGFVFCYWFRLTAFTKRLIASVSIGDEIICESQVKIKAGRVQMYHPRIVRPDKFRERKEMVYPTVAGVKPKKLAEIIRKIMLEQPRTPYDFLPYTVIARNRLPFLSDVLGNMHSGASENRYIKRLKYEELFLLIFGLKLQQKRLTSKRAPKIKWDQSFLDRLIDALPFRLTDDQKSALSQIVGDMSQDKPMLRLLQGDVGCGKTVVALLAAAVAVENGYQVAFMAPTQPLAQQIYTEALKLVQVYDKLKPVLLTGVSKDKEALYDDIAQHRVNLVVGTHALLQEGVDFNRLGLVIIDEQHRFGVEQRKTLMSKGEFPHVLIMSATPIPRSLSMVLYSRSDLTTIKQKPAGRGRVKSLHFYQDERNKAYGIVLEELKKSHQAYVVAPLIETSETLADVENVTKLFRELKRKYFDSYRVELLHGHLKPAVKEQIVNSFREGLIDVLVSTTVIEVGIDSPNATVIVVENAERFGLAQLHQLRGRVGRSTLDAYAIFITSRNLSEMAKERIKALLSTQDGFEISELDYKLRGSGEIIGTRQHGRDLSFADLLADKEIVAAVKDDVERLLKMNYPVNEGLKMMLEYRWQRRFGYMNVG